MCLLLGSIGVGKTLLLKRLNNCSNKGTSANTSDVPATIPTVGTNLVNISVSKKTEVTIRELGGIMAPIWNKYYKDCNALIYVIDLSNRTQISASCIQLLEILTHAQLQSTAILIVLNQVDVPGAMTKDEFNDIIRMDDILRHVTQKLTLVEASASDGQGLPDIHKWIQKHAKPSTS